MQQKMVGCVNLFFIVQFSALFAFSLMFLICGYCPCLSRLILPFFFVCLLGGCLITLLFFTDYHICIFSFIPVGQSFRSIHNCITGF